MRMRRVLGAAIAGTVLAAAPLPGSGADLEPWTTPPAQVLPVSDPDGPAAVDKSALAARLAGPLADPGLGRRPGAVVLDAATGEVLLDVRGGEARIPASGMKVLTAAAVLRALGPDHRLRTSVTLDPGTGGPARLTLVGGGDATLTTDPATGYPATASLADLAGRTARALRDRGIGAAELRYDAGRFTGPRTARGWATAVVASGLVMPVSALTLDGIYFGTADPAPEVADRFAELLTRQGVTVVSTAAGDAGDAEQIAAVFSAPMAALVERMLADSDNDLAEALFRWAAIGSGRPGSFAGGEQTVAAVLDDLGVRTAETSINDGSGISRANRVAPLTLATVLQSSVLSRADQSWLPPGLAVAGLTGTLADRFEDPRARRLAFGHVTGKTGTLTGVTTLSGVVRTRQNRPVLFAVLASDNTDALAGRAAVDAFAAAIAGCGCTAGGS